MKEKSNRYYLAISVAEYIIEGHNKLQAMEEFDITRGTFDRLLEFLSTNNYSLYLKAKIQLSKRHRTPKTS